MEVIQVRNGLAFAGLKGLLSRAITSTPLCSQAGLEECLAYILDDDKWMLVGVEDAQVRALALVSGPITQLFPFPQVALFYNEGSGELRRALSAAINSTISEAGYDRLIIANMTGHDAEVWARGMLPKGMNYKVLGEAIEVELRAE